MTITLTIPFVIAVIIQIALIIWFIKDFDDWILFIPMLCIALSVIIWVIYGGVYWW